MLKPTALSHYYICEADTSLKLSAELHIVAYPACWMRKSQVASYSLNWFIFPILATQIHSCVSMHLLPHQFALVRGRMHHLGPQILLWWRGNGRISQYLSWICCTVQQWALSPAIAELTIQYALTSSYPQTYIGFCMHYLLLQCF